VRRFLSTFITALCLPLFIASAVLWLRSYWVRDDIQRINVGVVNAREQTHVSVATGLHGALGFSDVFLTGPIYPYATPRPFQVQWHLKKAPAPLEYPFVNLQRVHYVPNLPGRNAEFSAVGFSFVFCDQTDPPSGMRSRTCVLVIPWPIVLLLTGVPPLYWTLRWRNRRRAIAASRLPCRKCGYSLIGNTSGVCPECGASAPHEQAPAGLEAS
jgi:hypothetical protein